MVDVKEHISKKLRDILLEVKFEGVPEIKISDSPQHGDYYTNLAMRLAKQAGKNPFEIAEDIAAKFEKDEYVSKLEVVKPGFINFWVSEESLNGILDTVLKEKEKFGNSKKNSGKKAVVEFSSPNIAKPFTVGHLRSTIIGSAVASLLKATGWEVFTDNHLGDWGTQFGKQIYAIKTWGNEQDIEKADNPVKELVALYVKFHEEAEKNPELEAEAREWFKKLENGDAEAKRLWQKCIDWSMIEFEKLYQKLGVKFSENGGKGYGESYFEDKMQPVLDELSKKALLKEDEGAKLVYFADDKFPPLMIVKQDGATLYATRDLATDKFRLEKHGSDVTIINEVGAEQSLYFQQLFEIENMLGWVKEGQRIHIRHGLYRFKEGKMSTRKGNTVWLEDVLDEAEKRAESLVKEKSSGVDFEAIAIGALKWNDLKRTPVQDIVFDWEDILNMQGNSGPYIQYTYVRTKSVFDKSGLLNISSNSVSHKLEKEEDELLRFLQFFPEVVLTSAETFTTSIVCNYLFELSQRFNLFYQKHSILEPKEGNEVRNFRLSLTFAVGQILKNGLTLLGIQTVEKM